MTSLFRLGSIAILSATSCVAQTSTVTFYSRGISLKEEGTVFLPKSEHPFGGLQGGWILDGSQRLARVRAGRFVTLHLNPGQHSFTDLGPTGPSKKSLTITLEAGGQYCVRLLARMTNYEVYANWENQIEEVPCQLAQREAAHLKPLDIKRVDPAFQTVFDPSTSFPKASQAHK